MKKLSFLPSSFSLINRHSRIALLPMILVLGLMSTSLVHGQNDRVGVNMDSPLSTLHIHDEIPGNVTGIRLSTVGQNARMHLDGQRFFLRNLSNAQQLVLDDNGNIGIGTQDPETRLHVKAPFADLLLDGETTSMLLYRQDGADLGYMGYLSPDMQIMNTNSSNINIGIDLNTHATLTPEGYLGLGHPNPSVKLHLRSLLEGDSTGIRIVTLDGTNASYIYNQENSMRIGWFGISDHLVLNNNGLVGVGTATPENKLHVKANNATLRLDGMNESMVSYYKNDLSAGFMGFNNNDLKLYNLIEGKVIFATSGSPAVTISSDGNLGIGHNNPTYKLQLRSGTDGDTTGIRIATLNGARSSEIFNLDDDMIIRYGSIQDQLVLDNSGRIGLNINEPLSKLHIHSDAEAHALQVVGSNPIGTWLALGNSDAGGKFFQFISTGTGNNGGAGNLLLYGSSAYGSVQNLALAVNGSDGRVAMGTTTYATGYKLSVKGKIISDGLRIQSVASWPDYVFDAQYNRPSLGEVAGFIEEHHHLPGFHPAAVMETEGMDMEEITIQQQEWIEVSTLFILEQEERIKSLESAWKEQSEELRELKEMLDKVLIEEKRN